MQEPLSRSELATKYDDKVWQGRLLRLFELVALLQNCIIEKNYKISDDLNAAIALSESGKKIRDQLIKKESVPTKEANLLVLLALVHIDPLVDVEKIDLEKLQVAISKEIVSGALLYPLVFGRQLYDKAATLFPEERRYLRHEDTMKLLRGEPQGVFQSGHYIVGPFGLIESSIDRPLVPTTLVPLQHCSDHSCRAIHSVQLTTSIDAPINRHRPSLNKVLSEASEDPSEWSGFLSDLDEQVLNAFDENDPPPAIHVLGDCFDDDELRDLFAYALDNTGGRLRTEAVVFGFQGHADKLAARLNRAQILQLLLTEHDAAVIEIIDTTVRSSMIEVPLGEVRQPRVSGRTSYGMWGYSGEVGPSGFRAVGDVRGLPLLRLATLCRQLFDRERAEEMDALAWALRNVEGNTPTEKLEEFLRTADPQSVIRTLVLTRRENVIRMCAELRIPAEMEDDALIHTMMWKLGFRPPIVPDRRDDYWVQHAALERVSTTAAVNLSLNASVIRATAANYFVELEGYLHDSLMFTTWALLHDHYSSDQPFVFREQSAYAFARRALSFTTAAKDAEAIMFTEKPTLSDLVQGFADLSTHISNLRKTENSFKRPETAYPKFYSKTALQGFPFKHVHPYLDLTAEAQVKIAETLSDAARTLSGSGIMPVRNGLLHANRDTPKPQQLIESLDTSRQALEKLEGIGCVRSTYSVVRSETDSWSRGTTHLRSLSGREITFTSPSLFQWVGLPTFGNNQYLVHGAVFAPPNAMLRFRRGFDSRYEDFWMLYPKRRERGNSALSGQSEGLSTPLQTGSFVGSRAD
jgi:hypothetical protein